MLVTSSWKILLFRERGLSTVIAAIGTALTSTAVRDHAAVLM